MGTTSVTAYGRRLIPQVLDELAEKDPFRVYATIPRTSDVKDGYRDVSVAELARCVNFMAKWLVNNFGRSDSFETITYIGLSDLRGPIVLLGAIKAGYKLFVPSPRNPPTTNCALMNETESSKLLYTAEIAPLIRPLRPMISSLSISVIPSLQEMLESDPEPYPYLKSFDGARNDPFVVLHSSGSTGLPKPITCTHGSWAAHDNEHNLPAPMGRKKQDSTVFHLNGEARLYLMLPFFHLGGFVFFLNHAICNTLTLVLGPPHIAPDAQLVKEIAQQQKLRGIMVTPALVEQLVQDPAGMSLINNLEFLACAGAPLPAAVGDRIKDAVKVFNFIGSTETFPLPELSKSPDDWIYHEFNPNLKHEMELYDPLLETYELVIFADESTKDTSPLYHNLPSTNPYYTKDLFTRHPEKPSLFKYYGRKDDILVLANGEKVNPIPLEQRIQGHPLIKGAIVVGNGRTQPALLMEPRTHPDVDLVEMLWPLINESNTYVPGQGRIARDKVIVATPEKPFLRTGKGTITRKLTEEIYKDEIEAIYSDSPYQGNIMKVDLETGPGGGYGLPKITSFLKEVLAISFHPKEAVGEDDDFFAHGLDSVQTLEIIASLKRRLVCYTSSSVAWISPRTIFYNPTISDLSKVLMAFLNEGIVPEEGLQEDKQSAIDEAVARYAKDLPPKSESRATQDTHTSIIAVLGSTGYLGSYFIVSFLKNQGIQKIICLNRSQSHDAQERQTKTLNSLDSTLGHLLHKLTYIQVKFGEPLFGLCREHYDMLVNDVDVILYNSWRLDFGLAIRSFEPFLRTTRDLVDLSAASKRSMRIAFISSVSSVGNLATKITVPEGPVDDALAAINTGYGQSKLAAERILVAANRRSGIPVSIIRIGQVGGPSLGTAGAWADQVWISAILRTSKKLGFIPSSVAPIDWVPVDIVSRMLESFCFRPAQEDPQVYNIVSDKAQPWGFLVDAARGLISAPSPIPLRDWVGKLRDISNSSYQDTADLPALKMLGFYETLGDGTSNLRYATNHAKKVSGIEFPVVDTELLTSWLKDWDL
ncbi:acetyl-CoA synthetase-like protein [Daldinia sp. FL1419]|nr:acetyl-CoA synthetase-like protein [Daldinia sp. FL1419]